MLWHNLVLVLLCCCCRSLLTLIKNWLISSVPLLLPKGQNTHENEGEERDFFYNQICCQTTSDSKDASRIHGPGPRNDGSTYRQAAATTGANPITLLPRLGLPHDLPASTIPVDSRLPRLPAVLPPRSSIPNPHPARPSPERAEQPEGTSDPPPPR